MTNKRKVERSSYIAKKYLAKDGHICLSKVELFIDNLLYSHNIPHLKEVPYPYDKVYNKNCKMKCDWMIGDTFVEYMGCIRHKDPIVRRKYRKIVNKKWEMCFKNGYNFIFITPDTKANIRDDLLLEFGGK